MEQLKLLFFVLLCAITSNFSAHSQVAQIGTTQYASLEAAVAAAQDGETIVLLSDCSGNGIKVEEGTFTSTGITVDFNGHTYTVDGNLVGSTGTETNGFQLKRNNKITFTSGTITSTKAKILIQNYSDLTLNGMTLTLNNPNYTSAYTLSNNNGNVSINNTHIVANPAGGYAFDVCRYANYPSVFVTVTGTSVIDGDIEVYASNDDAKEGFGLNLLGGTLNGDIVLDNSAKAALATSPDNAFVRKMENFGAEAPYGYCWSGLGVSKLVPAIAMIGNTGYVSLYDAVQEAQAGDTVVMLDNSTETATSTVNQAITIDLNGKIVTYTGTAFRVNADLTVTDNSQEGGGTINGGSQCNWVYNGATFTLDRINMNGKTYGIILSDGHVVVNNATNLSGGSYGILSQTTATNDIIVNGGTVTGAIAGVRISIGSVTLNGGNIIGTNYGTLIGPGNLTINGGSLNVTASNGIAAYMLNTGLFTMNGGTMSSPDLALYLTSNAVGTVNDGIINARDAVYLAYNTGKQTFNMNGGIINATGGGIFNNGQNKSEYATTINIAGGVINAKSTGIYHPGMGYLNFSGGTLNASTGIVMRNGKLTISGGTIHARGEDENEAYDFHDNGATKTGNALSIERSDYGNHISGNETFDGKKYAGTEVNISYGIFISDNAKAVASYIKTDDPIFANKPDGAERCLHFLTDGWYSNEIPIEQCNNVLPEDKERYDTPDPTEKALWTLRTPLAFVDGRGQIEKPYTISDQMQAVFAHGASLWCKDVGGLSIAKSTPASSEQTDYLRNVTHRTTDWDQSNWIELNFGNTDLEATLKTYEGAFIHPHTVYGNISDKLNYRLDVTFEGTTPELQVDSTSTYNYNVYCPANFLEKNLILNDGDQGALSPVNGDYFYLLNPKVQEVAVISYAVWDGENFQMLANDGEKANIYGFDGCFSLNWDYNMYGNTSRVLEIGKPYEFHAIVQRKEGSDYGSSYARSRRTMEENTQPQPSPNIVVCPIDLKDTSVITAISEVKTDAKVVSVKYVNAAGVVSDSPFDGFNIVIKQFSDGTTATIKQQR